MLADVVTVRREALLFHQRSHVPRRVILTGHPRQITTGGHAVVVVVAVRDQHGIQSGHLGTGDRELDHHRHVETAQQGIDHHRRAATVDQEPGHAQPPQNSRVCCFECIGTERLCLWGSGLPLHGWNLPRRRPVPMTATEATGASSVGTVEANKHLRVVGSVAIAAGHAHASQPDGGHLQVAAENALLLDQYVLCRTCWCGARRRRVTTSRGPAARTAPRAAGSRPRSG
jgi:hypothetical protein